MDKLLKVKHIIEKKITKNRECIQRSVESIAKMRKDMDKPDITLKKYLSLKNMIHCCEKAFSEASEQNKVFTTVMYIIDNVLNEEEEEK